MKKLKVYGVSRLHDATKVVQIGFNRALTDGEMKQLQDGLRSWINHGETSSRTIKLDYQRRAVQFALEGSWISHGETAGGEISSPDTSTPLGKVRG